jgi:formylglycine-generating enzyme required for sulfatase activity
VGTANDFNSATTQSLPAAFPKAFNGFYVMKHEVSQLQWINFFNTLTSIQKTARDITDATGKNADTIRFRNNIRWTGTGDATLNSNTHGNVACNYLNCADAMAYMDWAGLRPMTELEFEKASRGTTSPLTGELTWGQSFSSSGLCGSATQASGISNSGASNEVPSNSAANAIYGNAASVQGPLRVGSAGSNTRNNTGAAYWGAMNMGDNLAEIIVSMGNATGRTYTGTHGNGALSTTGVADVANWPNNTTGAGTGKRGGHWADSGSNLVISNRFNSNTPVLSRDQFSGFRAVRALPVSNVE